MDLAERHCLTIYDASYLELALRYDLPLATLDKALKLASQQEKNYYTLNQFLKSLFNK